jgi:hypothetical protein
MEDGIRFEGGQRPRSGVRAAVGRFDIDVGRQRLSARMAVVVDDKHPGPACDQRLNGVRPDKTGTPRNCYAVAD